MILKNFTKSQIKIIVLIVFLSMLQIFIFPLSGKIIKKIIFLPLPLEKIKERKIVNSICNKKKVKKSSNYSIIRIFCEYIKNND